VHEAYWILQESLGVSRGELLAKRELILTQAQQAELRDRIERRKRREPLQYILGRTDFRRITISIDRRALIPRPETEGLVELALEKIRCLPSPSILDVGTGSGVIALSILAEHPTAFAVGCDISTDALQLAGENSVKLGFSRRVVWRKADLFSPEFTALFQRSFDCLISNPPYVSDVEFQHLQPEIRLYEPAEALLAGGDGLDFIRRLAEISREMLQEGGALLCEIGETQCEAALSEFQRQGWRAIVKKDLSGKNRYIAAE
jgi:release factor glutamine methyltransferase